MPGWIESCDIEIMRLSIIISVLSLSLSLSAQEQADKKDSSSNLGSVTVPIAATNLQETLSVSFTIQQLTAGQAGPAAVTPPMAADIERQLEIGNQSDSTTVFVSALVEPEPVTVEARPVQASKPKPAAPKVAKSKPEPTVKVAKTSTSTIKSSASSSSQRVASQGKFYTNRNHSSRQSSAWPGNALRSNTYKSSGHSSRIFRSKSPRLRSFGNSGNRGRSSVSGFRRMKRN